MKKQTIRLIIAGLNQKSVNALNAGDIRKSDAYEKAATYMTRKYCRG